MNQRATLIHTYINNILCVYLSNQMFEESLTLIFFLTTNFITKCYHNIITIHIDVTNPLYFLIIELYKVILYVYYTHTHIYIDNIITKINNVHNQYQKYTHTNSIKIYNKKRNTFNSQTLTIYYSNSQIEKRDSWERERERDLWFTLLVGLGWTDLCCLVLG